MGKPAHVLTLPSGTMASHAMIDGRWGHLSFEAMVKEVNDHVRREHWKIMTISEMIASGCKGKPIMGVWSMKRKRNPLGVIAKCKARLCAHGGQTIEGVHYESTYAPVVTWTAIRFLLTASLINNWHTRQIDFVLACPLFTLVGN